MVSRYQCTLSDELLEKAVAELNEPRDNSERLKAIDSLRSGFAAKFPELKLPNDSDQFLLRFLRAKKFRQNDALDTLRNYVVNTKGWPEVYDRVHSPVLMSDALDAGIIVPLKAQAKDGSSIVVGRPGLGKLNLVLDMFGSIFLTMETLLQDEQVQICGVTVIQDMAYMTSDFAKQMTPLVAKKFLNIIQNSMPIRVRSLNATNEPKLFDVLYAVITPLMSEKMRKRYRLHGMDFSGLYEIIDKSVLPPMFAGGGEEIDKDEWRAKLVGQQTQL